MRILYLTTGFPFPLTSGLLRHYFFIRELSRRHAVTLVSLVGPRFAPEHLEALRPYTRQIVTFPEERPPNRSTRRAIWRARVMAQGDPAVERLGQAVRELLQQESYGAVVFSGKETFPAFRYLDGLPVVADLCDSTWVRVRSALPQVPPKRWPVLLLHHLRARAVERHLVRYADHVLMASARDKAGLGNAAATRTAIIPNGVDVDFWRRQSRERGADTIVFTGAMHYRPNVDAALHLIHHILPRVKRAVPAVRLFIVGRDPHPAVVAAGRKAGAIVTGFVEDVRPYLEQATVFAAPLRFGAGIQNKVLEAMAMEVPIVASPIAADGLRTEGGEQPPLVIARGARRFADELVHTLREHAASRQPDARARRYVEEHFQWRVSGEKLEKVLKLVTEGRPHAEARVAEVGEPEEVLDDSAGRHRHAR